MTVEELDGFFCALVCGPSSEPMRTYFEDVLGEELDEDSDRYSIVDPAELSTLLLRLWNEIAAAMMAGEPYLPVFATDDHGNPDGANWAKGFVHGMEYENAKWDRFIKNKEHSDSLAPMMILLADSDPELAAELKIPPIKPEDREEILIATAVSLSLVFKYFHPKAVKTHSHRK